MKLTIPMLKRKSTPYTTTNSGIRKINNSTPQKNNFNTRYSVDNALSKSFKIT